MGRPPRILLVEDNPDDEALTLRALTRCGVDAAVDVARDGAEALDYLFREGSHGGRASTDPRLVLLDIKLPKIDGVEVLRRIRADTRTRLLQVVMLTTSRERKDLEGAYSAGANSYIVK